MFKMTVDVRGSAEIDKWITKRFPRAVKQSQISTLNKVNRSIKAHAAREISQASGIKPVKLIKSKIKDFKANRRRLASGTYFRYGSIQAHMIGKPKWNRRMSGAKVKGFKFDGAFAAAPTMGRDRGVVKVYKRIGNTGDPVDDLRPERITLKPYRNAHTRAGIRRSKAMYQKTLTRELDFRLKRAGF